MKEQYRSRLLLFVLAALFALSASAFAADAPPRHDFPRVGQYEVLCGDFHMHTVMSDGKITTKERVKEAYDLGYDAIAITDHGRPVAYHVAKPFGESLGMVVLRGFETGIDKHEHFVILGARGAYRPRDSHRWAEKPGEQRAYYQDEMTGILEDDGFAVLAHPSPNLREQTLWGIGKGVVQGVEVSNGKTRYEHSFDWAREHNLILFANSDIHGKRPQSVSATLVLVEERSEKGVLDALRARRTVAWFKDAAWGREELLSDLMRAAVTAKQGQGKVTLTNHSPMPLKGAIHEKGTESPGVEFELGPYQETVVETVGTLDELKIEWTNVWTSPKENLTTTVPRP